jgi:glycosidase
MRGVQPKNLGKSGGIPLTDAVGIPVREAFRWDANLEAPGSAIWYRGDQWFWKDRFNRSHDGVSLQEEQARPDSLYHWYKQLLALRHARPEISAGGQRVLCDDDSAVLCILRGEGAQRTLLLVNLGKVAARPQLGASLVHDTRWIDLLDDGKPGNADAVLQPLQVRILGTSAH